MGCREVPIFSFFRRLRGAALHRGTAGSVAVTSYFYDVAWFSVCIFPLQCCSAALIADQASHLFPFMPEEDSFLIVVSSVGQFDTLQKYINYQSAMQAAVHAVGDLTAVH